MVGRRYTRPMPAGAVLLALALALLGLAATAVLTADAVGAGVPPALRVTIAGGHAAPGWALGLLARQEWACRAPLAASLPCGPETAAALAAVHLRLAIGAAVTFIVAFTAAALGRAGTRRTPPRAPAEGALRLRIGRSTGILAGLGHGAGIAAGVDVTLAGDDVCQNTVVFGSIGSGKTSGAINPFVRQAMRQDCGLLIFSIKGDYAATARRIAAAEGRAVTTLGPGARRCNLLAGLTPEIAASFLKSVVLLVMGKNDAAAVYVETATNLAANLLGVLSFAPGRFSLAALREVVYDTKLMKSTVESIEASIRDEESLERFNAYAHYVTSIYPRFENKIKVGALTTLSTILDCFKLPEIRDAFCTGGDDVASMQEVLDGELFVLELPLAEYGLSATTIYTMVRLRFMNVVTRRASEPTWNQTRAVGFICDEFQEIVAVAPGALSDLNFWDKSRSARCFGIVSGQGYASFVAKIGSPALTDALLQNFRQKICFQSEDETTIKKFVDLAGKVDVTRRAQTRSFARAVNPNGTTASNTAASQDRTMGEAVLDPQLWRSVLGRGKALCMLSIGGAAYDDVLVMPHDSP
jgi:type IV secretory pathway TraG/TraD family ATPase VirD4